MRTPSTPTKPQPKTPKIKRETVLIVDNDSRSQADWQCSFSYCTTHCKMRVVASGEEAQAILGQDPSVGIVFINMNAHSSGMSSFRLAEYVKEKYPKLPLAFLVKEASSEDANLAKEITGNDIICGKKTTIANIDDLLSLTFTGKAIERKKDDKKAA